MRQAIRHSTASVQAPLAPVTLTWLAGILIQTAAPLPPIMLIIVGIASAGAALWRWRRANSAVLALLLFWGCLGALRIAVWEHHPDAALRALLSDDPQSVQLHGLVVDDPVELFEPDDTEPEASDKRPRPDPVRGGQATRDTRHGTRDKGQTARNSKQVCVLQLQHVRMTVPAVPGTGGTGIGWQPILGRVRATIHAPRQLLRYGDEILVEGEWSRVPAPGNPGQYDWRAALARKRIHGLLRVRPYDGLVVLRQGQGNPVLAAVFQLRQRWERLIRAHFSPRDAGLLLGLLLGQRAEIDEDLKDAFQTTGTIHLLVISGFNVGLIAGLCELLLRLLGMPWRLRLVGSAIALGGYCVLTGLQPPVARATLMAWVVLGAYALDRIISWPNTLALAALVILVVNPTQLFDPGFQLSFGAVLSLLVFTSRWSARLERLGRRMHPAWLRRYVALSLSATAAIWVGLSPVLAWYFNLVSPVSMLANLLLTPLISALVLVGTTLLACGTWVELVVSWGSGMIAWLLQMIVQCVSWCRAIPGGYWFVGPPSPAWLAGYYALLVLTVMGLRRGWRSGRVLIGWVAALSVWLWSAVAARAHDSRWLHVEILDVGHGDSIFVRTPSGQTLLIDAGTQEVGRSRVVPFLRWSGLSTLDALLLTHSDEDHLGGAIPLLEHLRVKRLLTNGVRDDTMSARAVRRLAAARHVPETVLAAGMRLGGDPGVTIDVLHPPAGLVAGVAPPSNDNSIVVRLVTGTVSVLLAADIEEEGLPVLLGSGRSLQSTVLKVPHHGSWLGRASEAFFDAVRPAVAVLSVGRLHHLPAPETLEALSRTGAATYLTRDDGAVRIRTDGVHLKVRSFRRQKPQWDFGF